MEQKNANRLASCRKSDCTVHGPTHGGSSSVCVCTALRTVNSPRGDGGKGGWKDVSARLSSSQHRSTTSGAGNKLEAEAFRRHAGYHNTRLCENLSEASSTKIEILVRSQVSNVSSAELYCAARNNKRTAATEDWKHGMCPLYAPQATTANYEQCAWPSGVHAPL